MSKNDYEYPRESEDIIAMFGIGRLVRTKVPSGWIVERFGGGKYRDLASMCFVPDSEHLWKLEDLSKTFSKDEA